MTSTLQQLGIKLGFLSAFFILAIICLPMTFLVSIYHNKRIRTFLASTQFARENGYSADTLHLYSFRFFAKKNRNLLHK